MKSFLVSLGFVWFASVVAMGRGVDREKAADKEKEIRKRFVGKWENKPFIVKITETEFEFLFRGKRQQYPSGTYKLDGPNAGVRKSDGATEGFAYRFSKDFNVLELSFERVAYVKLTRTKEEKHQYRRLSVGC